ncbi:hypothetical protein JCM10207_001225 [Rhodosporidiobolus poonsookiae]
MPPSTRSTLSSRSTKPYLPPLRIIPYRPEQYAHALPTPVTPGRPNKAGLKPSLGGREKKSARVGTGRTEQARKAPKGTHRRSSRLEQQRGASPSPQPYLPTPLPTPTPPPAPLPDSRVPTAPATPSPSPRPRLPQSKYAGWPFVPFPPSPPFIVSAFYLPSPPPPSPFTDPRARADVPVAPPPTPASPSPSPAPLPSPSLEPELTVSPPTSPARDSYDLDALDCHQLLELFDALLPSSTSDDLTLFSSADLLSSPVSPVTATEPSSPSTSASSAGSSTSSPPTTPITPLPVPLAADPAFKHAQLGVSPEGRAVLRLFDVPAPMVVRAGEEAGVGGTVGLGLRFD